MTVEASDYQELADWLTTRVAGYLNVPPETIDIDTPLADCGVDSVAGLRLCADLQCEMGFDVETTIVWDYATIGAIAEYLTVDRVVPGRRSPWSASPAASGAHPTRTRSGDC